MGHIMKHITFYYKEHWPTRWRLLKKGGFYKANSFFVFFFCGQNNLSYTAVFIGFSFVCHAIVPAINVPSFSLGGRPGAGFVPRRSGCMGQTSRRVLQGYYVWAPNRTGRTNCLLSKSNGS